MSFLTNADFKDLLAALDRAKAQYLVVGGHAVGVHTRPRATKDLDIWIGEDAENRRRVALALRSFGAPEAICRSLEEASPDDIVWFGRAPNRVDFLQRLPGVAFEEAFSRATRTHAFGLRVPVISIDDLIANKRAVGREQDLRDVRALERARERER